MSEDVIIKCARRLWPEQDANNFTYFDFLHARASPRQALFYSRLFWPEFVEIDDMIFLRDVVEDELDRQRVLDALATYKDKAQTEHAFNMVEIAPLFGGRMAEFDDNEEMALAEQMKVMWAARLHSAFPGRTFVVEILSAEETGGELAVRFSQER
jgi:hypothetical protein